MKTITIADVAKKAGVSKSTVSQYMNGRYDYMGLETKERIRTVIEELEYNPNAIARSLKSKKTKAIGVIVASILYEFTTKVTRAIEDICYELGYQVIICNADEDPSKEKHYIEMLLAKQVDGIISFPTSGNSEVYQTIINKNFPLVFIDRIIKNLKVSTVLLDNEKASKFLVEELVNNGYRQIAIVTNSPMDITPRKERVAGYKEALINLDISINETYISVAAVQHIEKSLEKLLKLPEPPEAIIATNDLTLMGILKYVKKINLKIPQDIAVVSVDDIYFARFFNPPLTTVAQPAFEMGKKAAELLINKIENKDDHDNRVYRFDPELRRRDSTYKKKDMIKGNSKCIYTD